MILNSGATQQANLPDLNTSQFGAGGVGDIASSVNLFRGDVNLPLTLIDLPGINGLSVSVSASYGSNVRTAVETSNQDAPTGILGVGWTIPFESIAVGFQETGNNEANSFYLLTDGASIPAFPVGETGGVIRYQLRTAPFWSMVYFKDAERWIVTREDGTKYYYGSREGEALEESDGLQYGVRWGNWVGSTNHPGGERYAVAWNLVRIENALGNEVRFSYETTDVAIGRGAASYTQSARLSQIVDSFGQIIDFAYREKQPFEIRLPEIPPIPTGDASFQFQYETKYLDRITVSNDQSEPLLEVVLQYEFNDATRNESNDDLTKRYLTGVYERTGDGLPRPGIGFEYFDDAVDVNPGAMSSVTYPDGGVASFTYASKALGGSPSRSEIRSPGVGFVPRVWHGADYVVVTWYHAGRGELRLDVYTWFGLWTEWQTRSFDKVSIDDLAVHPSLGFFAVSYRQATTKAFKLLLFSKDAYQPGNWTEHETTLGNSWTDLRIATGRDFVAVQRPNDRQLVVEQWNGLRKDWVRTTLATPANNEMALGASTAGCVGAYYVNGTLNFQVFRSDRNGDWKRGDSKTISTSVDWEITTPESFWSMAPAFASATFATGRSENGSKVDVALVRLMWTLEFEIESIDVISGSQAMDLSNPILTTVSTSAMIGNAQNLYRYDGQTWDAKTAALPNLPSTYSYVYGPDIAIVAMNQEGETQLSSVVYNPYQSNWEAGPIGGSYAADETAIPTVNGDFVTAAIRVYHRDARNRWTEIHRLVSTADLRTVRNHAPAYIAYELSGNRSTQVEFFLNGAAAGSPVRLSDERIYTGKQEPGSTLR